MKYDVEFSCGHKSVIELFGKGSDRESRIAWYERSGVCPDCYREMQEVKKSVGCEEVEMTYRQYKTEYPDCKTKTGSYNGAKKTIIVYVPIQPSEA